MAAVEKSRQLNAGVNAVARRRHTLAITRDPSSRSAGHPPQHQQPGGARRIRVAASPGARTEMQLAGPDRRVSIAGRLGRCYVAALDPIRYRGVVLFDSASTSAKTANRTE
jgi:hypothetical protein